MSAVKSGLGERLNKGRGKGKREKKQMANSRSGIPALKSFQLNLTHSKNPRNH